MVSYGGPPSLLFPCGRADVALGFVDVDSVVYGVRDVFKFYET